MGNRSYVAFPEAGVAVYLHWNGGLESVVAFLDFMNERGDRGETYGAARFCQIVGNFFGGTLSLGVTGCTDPAAFSDEDNGCFVVGYGPGHELMVARWFKRGEEVPADRLAAALDAARKHPYSLPDKEGKTLLDAVRAANAIPADAKKAA